MVWPHEFVDHVCVLSPILDESCRESRSFLIISMSQEEKTRIVILDNIISVLDHMYVLFVEGLSMCVCEFVDHMCVRVRGSCVCAALCCPIPHIFVVEPLF